MDKVETDYVLRMFSAITNGDMTALKSCFAPGALIWHNDDEVDRDVDAVCAVLSHVYASSTSMAYREQRITRVGKVLFAQHVLTAQLRAGGELRMPAMMRIELADDGRVARVEEYYDSRASDCLK